MTSIGKILMINPPTMKRSPAAKAGARAVGPSAFQGRWTQMMPLKSKMVER
jgi:hypothetical protein